MSSRQTFWGAVVKADEPYTLKYNGVRRKLILRQVTLAESSPKIAKGENISVMCTVGIHEAVNVCLVSSRMVQRCVHHEFEELQDTTFSTNGSACVHLAGYFERVENENEDMNEGINPIISCKDVSWTKGARPSSCNKEDSEEVMKLKAELERMREHIREQEQRTPGIGLERVEYENNDGKEGTNPVIACKDVSCAEGTGPSSCNKEDPEEVMKLKAYLEMMEEYNREQELRSMQMADEIERLTYMLLSRKPQV